MNAFATAHRPVNTMQSDDANGAGEAFPGESLEAARERLVTEIKHAPEQGELFLALGHLEMRLENYKAALAAFTSAAAVLPKLAAAHSSRALACQKLGRSAEAAQAAIRAVWLDPCDAAGLKVLARIHLNAGQHEAAEQACRRVLRDDAHDAEAGQMVEEAMAQAAKLAENLFDRKSCPAAPPRRTAPGPV
jgi:Flp pilus assembly protein TadD